jgi:hypothetical protein
MESIIDKMKPLQELNKEDMGNKALLNQMKLEQMLYNMTIKEKLAIEEWLGTIFEDNKELFKDTNKQEFVKYALYGK